jgi:hypothetical protein
MGTQQGMADRDLRQWDTHDIMCLLVQASFDAFAGAGGVASASAGADVGSGTALDAE